MRLTRRRARAFRLLSIIALTSCAPPPPRFLETPKDVPPTWRTKKMYHTANALIYAENDAAAAETDGWLNEVRSYIKKNYNADLEKGVVLVMEPEDPPVVPSIADELALERNPAIMHTQPKHLKSLLEVRAKLAAEGVPEGPMIRGATIPLPPFKLEQLDVKPRTEAWAVSAPSHELALKCGMEVGAAAIRKKRPDMTVEQAQHLASMTKDSLAKAFEVTRGDPVFMMWVQRHDDWSYEQKRDAINARIRYTFRVNWLPPPKDEDLDW